MYPKYEDKEITEIWSDSNKYDLWQDTELAAIQARFLLGRIEEEIYEIIHTILVENPIDIIYLKQKESELQHDLEAFLAERRRHLPVELQKEFHKYMTSYDTEEAAFARMLKRSIEVVKRYYLKLEATLIELALKYRYTVMFGHTHHQGAGLQTFGKVCLTWLRVLRLDIENLERASGVLRYSKLAGIIGNYGGGLDPELEKEALEILGFEPYYGATQIMPRELYAPIAQALTQTTDTIDKIATDIRLGAKSDRPIYQEPFGKKQKGSSAMPHKKNTILTERLEGMARLADGYSLALKRNIKTWQERTIEQSSVERVAWPDLFHTAVYSLKTIEKVLQGLVVFPDNMLGEIIDSRGCYASNEAKEFLREAGVEHGLTSDEAYRIVQLAAFLVFEPEKEASGLRENPPISLLEAEGVFDRFQNISEPAYVSIKEIIAKGNLRVSPELEATESDVKRWNEILEKIFSDVTNLKEWERVFSPAQLLKEEKTLYKEILGV